MSQEEVNDLDHTYGLNHEELTQRFSAAIQIDEEIRKIKGIPSARYNIEKKEGIS